HVGQGVPVGVGAKAIVHLAVFMQPHQRKICADESAEHDLLVGLDDDRTGIVCQTDGEFVERVAASVETEVGRPIAVKTCHTKNGARTVKGSAAHDDLAVGRQRQRQTIVVAAQKIQDVKAAEAKGAVG